MDKFEYTPTPFMLPTSRYSKAKADHAVAFINSLCHVKTKEWFGKSFELLPWEEQIIRDIFGTVRKSDNCRQFRTAFIEVPKKQGKSELAAAVALYLLCADGEPGAEIYGCANDKKQAQIVFDVAREMVLMNRALRRYCKVTNSQKRIIFSPTRSFYVAVSKEVPTKFGLNIQGCVFDELLGQPDRKLFDVMTQGGDAVRRESLMFIITTAGNDRHSICWNQHTKALDILAERKIDSTFYPVVYAAPDDADWTDPEVWKAACPSLDITVPLEYYENKVAQAKEDVDLEVNFRQFFLNQWLSAERKWLPMDRYDVGNTPFSPEDLRGRKCYGGLDLASTDDIAAFVLVFPPDEEHGEYFVLPFFWIPAGNMERRVKKDHVPYDKWQRAGFLETTDGNIIHYDFIEKKIKELSELYDIQQVGFDRWSAIQMAQNLDAENIEMVAIGQGYSSMSPPSKELMRIVLDGKLRHGGNPALRWMFENVFIETDAAGNIKPSKKKSSEKIDGAVATIMALNLAVRHEESGSVYDHRGLLVLGDD